MNTMDLRARQTRVLRAVGCSLLTVMLTLWSVPQAALAQWATSGSDIYNSNTGNVGIGTITPLEKLDVRGNVTLQAVNAGIYQGGGVTGALTWRGMIDAAGENTAAPIINIRRTGGPGATDLIRVFTDNGITPSLTVTGSGNIGIGMTNPIAKLHVASGGAALKFPSTDGGDIGLQLEFCCAVGHAPALSLKNTATGGRTYRLASYADGTSQSFRILDDSAGVDRLTIDSGGNVGIGTTSPGNKLDVAGDIAVGTGGVGRLIGNAGSLEIKSASNGLIDFVTRPSGADTIRMRIQSDGNVGIGTTNPLRQLHIYGPGQAILTGLTDSGATGATLYLQDSGGTVNAGGAILFGALQGNFAGIKSTIQQGGQNTVGNLDFQTRSGTGDTSLTSRLFIEWTGNVGIGTSTPSTKLHVVGDVTVTGNIAAKYQDVAEWVPALNPLAAGTVLVLDTQQSNQVLPSSKSYDTRVAGVVSDMPGILLGEAGEGKVKAATTGRVKVKVDATKAPIRVGDLLVTSDKEGKAMRSDPLDLGGVPIHRPGTLIGKALEPLSGGQGEILVLLSLQ